MVTDDFIFMFCVKYKFLNVLREKLLTLIVLSR